MNEQIYSAMFFQQLLKADKLEKENKQLKEKTKPKKEKVFYGYTDLDKQKVPADIARDMVALLLRKIIDMLYYKNVYSV